jgi:hypothetical protein
MLRSDKAAYLVGWVKVVVQQDILWVEFDSSCGTIVCYSNEPVMSESECDCDVMLFPG